MLENYSQFASQLSIRADNDDKVHKMELLLLLIITKYS